MKLYLVWLPCDKSCFVVSMLVHYELALLGSSGPPKYDLVVFVVRETRVSRSALWAYSRDTRVSRSALWAYIYFSLLNFHTPPKEGTRSVTNYICVTLCGILIFTAIRKYLN